MYNKFVNFVIWQVLYIKISFLVSVCTSDICVCLFVYVEGGSEIQSQSVTCDTWSELMDLELSTCDWIIQDGCWYQVWILSE